MEDICKGCIFATGPQGCTMGHQNSASVAIFNVCCHKKEDLIAIQVHDYDELGNYRIVEERKATLKEVYELKKKAYDSLNLDWTNLPEHITHIVYYAELVDDAGKVCFAGIYLRGNAYCDEDFDRIFHRADVGYVGAFHRRI